jgi:flavin reductase (DIM6/NTAB) family NADH-FMN oxidoreductase RutF
VTDTPPRSPDRTEMPVADLGRRAYSFLNCLVAPRPIAWVSTVDAQGRRNLAPHSYFTIASAEPAVVSFTSIGRKDSLRNIEATGELTISVVPWRLREAANLTSIDAPPGTDEFEVAGLTPVPSVAVRPPRVGEAPASMECRLLEVRSFGELPRSGHVVFAEVLHVSVDPACLAEDGLPDLGRMGNATRADRMNWFSLGEREAITRPVWAEQEPQEPQEPGTARR